jgi:hypothetical protein
MLVAKEFKIPTSCGFSKVLIVNAEGIDDFLFWDSEVDEIIILANFCSYYYDEGHLEINYLGEISNTLDFINWMIYVN